MPKLPLTPVKQPVVRNIPDKVLSEDDLRARWQEWVRAGITICFLVLLLIVILFSCWEARSWDDHWNQTKEMLQIILPALTGLLGSSLGFYFGSRPRNTSKE